MNMLPYMFRVSTSVGDNMKQGSLVEGNLNSIEVSDTYIECEIYEVSSIEWKETILAHVS